jgi:hypothetical protein
MKKSIIAILTTIITVSLIHAATFIPEIKDVITPELLQELTNAKQAAETNNYSTAITCMDEALTMTEASEFADPDQGSGPMNLQLEVMKLYYDGKQSGFSPAPILQGVNQLFAIYETDAQDNNWYAYNMLYLLLAKHHAANNESDAVEQVYESALAYSPRNEEIITGYINWALAKNKTDNLKQRVKAFKRAGGIIPVDNEIAVIDELKAQDDPETYKFVKEFLKAHPTEEVGKALTVMREEIDVNNIVQVKDYYDFLSWLALNQPSDEGNIEQVSQILNEREKVLLIFPEI